MGVELGLPPFALVAIEAVVGISVQVVRNSSATSSYLRKVATLICGHRHTYARARPSTTTRPATRTRATRRRPGRASRGRPRQPDNGVGRRASPHRDRGALPPLGQQGRARTCRHRALRPRPSDRDPQHWHAAQRPARGADRLQQRRRHLPRRPRRRRLLWTVSRYRPDPCSGARQAPWRPANTQRSDHLPTRPRSRWIDLNRIPHPPSWPCRSTWFATTCSSTSNHSDGNASTRSSTSCSCPSSRATRARRRRHAPPPASPHPGELSLPEANQPRVRPITRSDQTAR